MMITTNTKKYNILMMDEEPHIINLVKLSLDKNLFSVDGVNSVKEALELIKKNTYDCVLSEIIIEGIDNYELCKAIRANPKTAEIPFIFLTIKSQMSDILHAIDMGADDYIKKPFDPLELERRIKLNLKE